MSRIPLPIQLPLIFGTPAPESPYHRMSDQHFGLVLTAEDFLNAMIAPMMNREYYRPWRQTAGALEKDYGSIIMSNKDKFQVNLDVQHFSPEEINVKTVDGYVVIEGKHEEKKDQHGFISRHFVRRYAMPPNCDAAALEAKLSSDGVLMITAPKVAPTVANARVVPITPTGPIRKENRDTASQPEPEADANGTAS